MLASAARIIFDKLGYEVRRKSPSDDHNWFSESTREDLTPEKALDSRGRFREIVSDPLNILIERDAFAGVVRGGLVKLHTGLVVPTGGDGAYYGDFSDILIVNRGVHEPLEEFVFQELVRRMHQAPVMLELGAYWGHYSMWMKKARPAAQVFLVEPEKKNLDAGQANFRRNNLTGTFINASVGTGLFEVDLFLQERNLDRLDVLHADIQGAELEMLEGCSVSMQDGKISYCLISTHSQVLHAKVIDVLSAAHFRIEASADFDHETTSFDGIVFAAHKSSIPVLKDFKYFGREKLCSATTEQLIHAIESYKAALSDARIR